MKVLTPGKKNLTYNNWDIDKIWPVVFISNENCWLQILFPLEIKSKLSPDKQLVLEPINFWKTQIIFTSGADFFFVEGAHRQSHTTPVLKYVCKNIEYMHSI